MKRILGMKRNILLVLFLGLAVWQLVQIVNLNQDLTDLSVSQQMLYQQNKTLGQEMRNNDIIVKKQHWFEGKRMEDMVLVDFYSKDTLSLSSLLSMKRTLFLFISEESCTTCYLSYLKQINRLAKKQDLNRRIILLADYKNLIGLKTLLLDHEISIKVYSIIKSNDLFKNNTEPISFLLTKEQCIDNVFVHHMSNSSQVEDYLKIMEERLLND